MSPSPPCFPCMKPHRTEKKSKIIFLQILTLLVVYLCWCNSGVFYRCPILTSLASLFFSVRCSRRVCVCVWTWTWPGLQYRVFLCLKKKNCLAMYSVVNFVHLHFVSPSHLGSGNCCRGRRASRVCLLPDDREKRLVRFAQRQQQREGLWVHMLWHPPYQLVSVFRGVPNKCFRGPYSYTQSTDFDFLLIM